MMKKISTGERINIQDIRRGIDQLRLPDSEAEIAGEQLFVEELMDTTPSSSFGEDAWRDGYIYDRGSGHGRSPQYYSDDDASAEEVVTSANHVSNDTADSQHIFEKVEVTRLTHQTGGTRTSLLSGALAAVRSQENLDSIACTAAAAAGGGSCSNSGSSNCHCHGSSCLHSNSNGHYSNGSQCGGTAHDPGGTGGPFGNGAGATRGGSRSSSTHENEEDLDMADTGGCSARQLISAVLKQCAVEGVALKLCGKSPHLFDLRIADDGGVPDLDFPELDASAAIIDVGVDEFVLCDQGKTAPPLLVIRVLVEGRGGCKATSSNSSLVLEVSFWEPGCEYSKTCMSLPIELLPDPLWFGASNVGIHTKTRSRGGSSSRTSAISQEGGSSCDPSASTRIRNVDTGEEIPVAEYDMHVPKAVSPKRLFSKKGYSSAAQWTR